MKKIIATVVTGAVLMGIATAAMATATDWSIYLKAQNPLKAGAAAVKIGTATGKLDTKDSTDGKYVANTGAQAQIAISNPSWPDSPALYGTDQRAPLQTGASTNETQSWDLRMWVGTGYSSSTVDLIWYGSGSGLTVGTIGGKEYTYTLDLVDTRYAAISGLKSWTFTPGFQGSSTAPLNTISFNVDAGLKMADASAAGSGIQFKLTAAPVAAVVTPEPSSIIAMLSGIVGMAGMAIRRRK